jgi:hypothetical protein
MTDETVAAVAAERDRIRLAILGCTRCRKVHEYREATCKCGQPDSGHAHTWADPDDGHAYSPAYRDQDMDTLVRGVTGG